MAEIECRRARPADWAGIWAIVSAVIAAADTYMFPPDLDEGAAQAAWMLDGPRSATYVAAQGDDVVGTAFVKPNQGGPGDHVANAGWMVAPDAAGRGVGRALANYVLEDAVRLGFTAMQFNAVVATNTRAIALWESLGFEIVGTVPDAFRHPTQGPVAIHVMYRRL